METPDTKNGQIASMLEEGHSYSKIQEELGVSPNRIAAVKKQLFSENSNDTALFNTMGDPDSAILNMENVEKAISKHNSTASSDAIIPSHRTISEAEIKLEMFKAELKHEEIMAKINFLIEQNKQKSEVLKQHNEHMAQKSNEIEIRKKLLERKCRKLIDRCEEGYWETEEVDDYLQDIESLLYSIEEFAIIHNIETESLTGYNALKKIHAFFQEESEDMEMKEEREFLFDQVLKRTLNPFFS